MTKRIPNVEYTAEQIAIITSMMADGVSARTIWEAVSAVPGGRPTVHHVSQRMYKIRHPSGPSHQKPAMQSAPGKPAPKPRAATLTFIGRWARDRGITFGGIGDLPIINAHAASRGLPAFEVAA